MKKEKEMEKENKEKEEKVEKKSSYLWLYFILGIFILVLIGVVGYFIILKRKMNKEEREDNIKSIRVLLPNRTF